MTEVNKSSRISFDESIVKTCLAAGQRSTCRHRDQGAVIVKDKRVISTGYNGAPPDQQHCIDLGFCSKEEGLVCRAEGLHAESNAIISAARLGICVKGTTMYCVYSPCRACCNMVKAAGIQEVVYMHVYEKFTDGPGYLDSLRIHTRMIG